MPSLADAYARLARAEEHLQELRGLVDAVLAEKLQTLKVEPNLRFDETPLPAGELRELLRVDNSVPVVLPERVRLLIGDTANSFRSALDYLIGQLAELDSGPGLRRTQFPVESSPEGFLRRRANHLEGVSDHHVAALEQLQPYAGAAWTASMVALSNLDKHNALVTVIHDAIVSIELATDVTESGGTRLRGSFKIAPTLSVALDTVVPIVETLQQIQAGVRATLDSFNPEFGTR